MSIHIPHLVLLILAWAGMLVTALVVVTLIAMLVEWCLKRIEQAYRVLMCHCGCWAAFWNYLQVQQLLMEGGLFKNYLKPREPAFLSWHEERCALYDAVIDHMSVDMLFEVVPHPEMWRPWMRLIGCKKPVDVKKEQA